MSGDGRGYYAGGYFWWHDAEGCPPYATMPLWRPVWAGLEAEAVAQR